MKFRDFTFEPKGCNAAIIGKNRIGKTTIFSAFLYSLFGKDIYDNSENQFSLKTKDENNQVIPMVDHIVESTLSIDDEPLILKRNFQETRTRKNRKLTGHTTSFWINDEPDVKKKDFESRIAEIISFDLFKLLTSVTAFADLPWKTRREQLFRICGDVKEDALGKAEKQKKIVASKKEEIEKKKKFIPARIDEKNRDLTAIADYSQAEIKARIATLEKQIQDIKSDSTQAVFLKERAELETRLSQIKADQAAERLTATEGIRAEIGRIEDNHINTNFIISRIGHDIEFQKGMIEAAKTEIADLYDTWDRITKEEPDILDLCPTCQKPFLPEEKESVRAEFNLQQSKKKKEINTVGKKAKGKKEKAETEKAKLEANLKVEQANIIEIEKNLDKKKIELKELQQTQTIPIPERIKKCATRIADIDDLLSQDDRKHDTLGLEAELEAERSMLAEIDASKKTKIRIKELKQEEKDMATAIEKLEEDLSLSEQKLEKEARLVEEAVNTKFTLVKFQLFKEHLNTAIDPCCKILIDGNEWQHGTSTSEEIRAGLDIIRVLNEFYEISCPVFIDRCESVSDPIPEMQSQIIRLIVDSEKKELEIVLDK